MIEIGDRLVEDKSIAALGGCCRWRNQIALRCVQKFSARALLSRIGPPGSDRAALPRWFRRQGQPGAATTIEQCERWFRALLQMTLPARRGICCTRTRRRIPLLFNPHAARMTVTRTFDPALAMVTLAVSMQI